MLYCEGKGRPVILIILRSYVGVVIFLVLFAFYAYLLAGRGPHVGAHTAHPWSTAGVVVAGVVAIVLLLWHAGRK